MALSITPQASPLATRLVEETAATSTAENNVTGAAGSLYMVDVDNPNGTVVYLKIYDNAAPTIGTTPADWVFRIPASARRTFAMPLGLAFTALSFAVVTGADQASVAAPASGVLVRLVTS
ncbi:hypothetical protein Rctr197k_171 [Virus Rctr197k]|nr:hypothetical protein Rctr197k_171 [Virus Rctr197k]